MPSPDTGLFDRRMCFKPRGKFACIFAMRFHPQVQGFQTAQRKKTIERSLHAANGVLQEGHLFCQLFVITNDQHAANNIGMAIQIFRGRMHHQMCAEFQRALQNRRRKSVIDRKTNAALAGKFGQARDIDNFQ